MISWRMLKLSDPQLWAAVVALIFIGLLAIFSSTFKSSFDAWFFVKRQLLSLLLGLGGLAVFLYFDYRHLKKASPYFYTLSLLFLAGVLFAGASALGAQRWVQLGPFSFQPSELSKLSLIIVIAAFFSERRKFNSLWEIGALLVLFGLPFLLTFKQPDLGTALVFAAILIGMLAASDTSPKMLLIITTPLVSLLLRPIFYLWIVYLIAIAGYLFLTRAKFSDWALILGLNLAVGVALPFIWHMLKVYQRQRIVAFLNPGADPYGAGYHTLQSMIAVGGGGFFGKGFLQGTQTQLQFIPEQHSDFIFSVIGEEFGFLGSLLVLGLFALIVWRALKIAGQARDRLGGLLAAGIATMLTFHVFANVGMAVGILPVVGIPLPLMSFGGTSLFVSLAAVGILQNIAMRRHKIIF
ncbi:MAG TPA: rod shape-determining protein RodA [Candidatus Sulfotelmatobacter sp.]|nr:rod shape-determining protein RodA [Candidatus Sulfotelmatobacter sp.]